MKVSFGLEGTPAVTIAGDTAFGLAWGP